MTEYQFKLLAKAKLEKATGLSVKLNQIVLLEGAGDGHYVLFRVGDLFYSYNCSILYGETFSIYQTDALEGGLFITL